MKLRSIFVAPLFGCAAVLMASSAGATTFYSFTGPTADTATNSSLVATFAAPGTVGSGDLSFTIDGYNTLDGQNFYEDDFTLNVNGTDILVGTWNLGGGGPDQIYLNSNGAVADNISGNGVAVTRTGGKVNVDVPIALLTSTNTLTFTYTSLGAGHAGFQGIGDEGWGLQDIAVNGETSTVSNVGVPEPISLSIFGAGLVAAASLRRRRVSK